MWVDTIPGSSTSQNGDYKLKAAKQPDGILWPSHACILPTGHQENTDLREEKRPRSFEYAETGWMNYPEIHFLIL